MKFVKVKQHADNEKQYTKEYTNLLDLYIRKAKRNARKKGKKIRQQRKTI